MDSLCFFSLSDLPEIDEKSCRTMSDYDRIM